MLRLTRLVKGPSTEALEREYVYADPVVSISDLAERHGLARSNVAAKANAGRWFEKREEFRRKLSDATRDALAEKWAEMRIALYERQAKMAMRYFDLFDAALEAGEVKVNAKDMLGIAAMMRAYTGDMMQAPVANVVVDPDTGDVFEGTADDARAVIERIKRLQSGEAEPDGE